MLSSCPVCLKVYLALLNHPLDQWRITHQELYIDIRDNLSQSVGCSAEDLQKCVEHLVALTQQKLVNPTGGKR
jgi:hypothetical protein